MKLSVISIEIILTLIIIITNNNFRGTYTDLKEEFIRLQKLKKAYIKPLVLSTMGIIPSKLHESLKPLNLRPALYILTQNALMLNTFRIFRTFLAEQRISVW